MAAAIAEDSRRLYLLLALGFVLLYATLFRIVAVASRRLRHQALHDDLTDLPNRALLYDRMEAALTAAERSGEPAALLLVDLDRFKEVNDTLGHDSGDRLLEEVAARLQGVVRRGDTLARLGGDEFAVLLRGLPDRGMAAELAGRLQDAIARPFLLNGVSAVLDASIGIAHCPEHGTDVHTLVQRADVAMYDAKRSRTSIETYSPDRDPYSSERLQLLGELRAAIGAGELVLHYQPKVDVATQRVIGVEALVRWQHPVHGLLGPVEFVPLAERTGAIGDLTRWVLDNALAQARVWRDAGLDLTMAVNLAAPNIADATLPDAVAELLERHGVPGDRLECEISEHTVMADPRRAMAILERLRALGVRLSLDDFGTGHSSLSYLKRLPLDEVKIDRSFVMGMTDDDNDAAIVRTTIDLARNLGLEVVAEGVESQQILNDLSAPVLRRGAGLLPLAPAAGRRARRLAGDARGDLRRQRELARPGAEAELEQPLLVGRADDRLAVDALERELAHAAALDGLHERLERRGQPLVVGLRQHLEALAAALDVEHGLAAGEHDVGARLAGGRAVLRAWAT